MSEIEIKTHLDFILPFSNQHIYINDKYDRLVEVFEDSRVFIYKAEPYDGPDGVTTRWQLIKKIRDYPTEFGRYYALDFFSPDFSRFLVYDKQNNVFHIKDTYVGVVIATIPQDYMNMGPQSDLNLVLSRFKWLSLNTIQIMSDDEHGVEKILEYNDAQNKFCETTFNVRNMSRNELE
jgi:hypothetical protein